MAYRQIEEKIKNPPLEKPVQEPEQPIGRTLELEALRKVFAYVSSHPNPLHIWIWGPQGTGKTLCATYAATELTKSKTALVAHSNCWSSNSLYALVNDIIDQFGILRAELQDTRFKIDRIRKHVKDKQCVFVIDEIDRLDAKERNAVLYQFMDLQNFWIVAISHKDPRKLGIEPRVWSRLSPIMAAFNPYTTEEILNILKYDLRKSHYDVTPTSQQLQELAEICNGDARIAKKLLVQKIILGLSDVTPPLTEKETRRRNKVENER
jgi:cell division control protein 6